MTQFANWPTAYPSPEWFIQDRFGLFIHFGLFSIGARHEWYMTTEKIEPKDYRKRYFDFFDPDLFDAKTWAAEAKKAGVRYMVFTTKHHEGFALWDSQLTDYKVTNTSFKRDFLAELLPAFRAEGIKVGLYHSLIDWYHPHFTLDGLHPQRDNQVERAKNEQRDIRIYQDFIAGQVEELVTNYGKIDYMWFDFPYSHRDWGWSKGKGAQDWDSERLAAICRKHQPEMLLNDRLGLGHGVVTPEQFQPEKPFEKDGLPVLWEACQTMYGTWGYDRDNQEWKSSDMLIKMLIDTVSKNGNFLMNIGPNARGEIDSRTLQRLHEIGEWMRLHQRAIYSCGPSKYLAPSDCRYTQNNNKLYLHIFSYPYKQIYLKGIANQVAAIHLLNDGSEISYRGFDPDEVITSTEETIQPDDLLVLLPTIKPTVLVPVLEITLQPE
ncbi:alpha-L-fucosidase [Enterococcus sp. DIV0876]|uniref:alpha-L-fucosidase n=1 Tax=Enterococcus sp. DIV0876 TaxID=2774633 RepID=UPI003D2FB8AA